MVLRFTGVSFINALDLPLALISLLTIIGNSKSKSLLLKNGATNFSETLKVPSTTHFFSLSLSTEVSAR